MDGLGDPGYAPGSRSIKIPFSHTNENVPAPAPRARRGMRTQLAESADTSDGGFSSRSSSRTSETILNSRKTAAFPASTYTTSTTYDTAEQSTSHQRKDKQKADLTPPNTIPAKTVSSSYSHNSPMSPSMLSSSSYKSINLNIGMSEDDGPARIITYTKQSQGFTWNDELFLPSYLLGRRYRYGGSKARRRRGSEMDDDDDGVGDFDEDIDHCPVTDIFVTDEEAAAMLP